MLPQYAELAHLPYLKRVTLDVLLIRLLLVIVAQAAPTQLVRVQLIQTLTARTQEDGQGVQVVYSIDLEDKGRWGHLSRRDPEFLNSVFEKE